MKIDRLLSIIIYLQNHELVSARKLAERFNVTIRTIQRDMETIELAGIPIVSIQGPSGGYGIMENYKMDSQLMSVEDLYYIITSLKSVGTTLTDDHIDETLEKMKTLLPSGIQDVFSEKNDKLSIDFSMLGGDPRQRNAFQTVREAVNTDRLLRFSYTNNKLESVIRTVEPMTIAFKWRAWYLFAWCRLKEDYRLFRISRIKEPEVLPVHFKRRPKSFDSFLQNSHPEGSTKPVNLTLKFDADIRPLVEEFHKEENCIENPDGSLTVKTSMPEDGWVYGFILSYGTYVEVLEPQRIRNNLKEMADNIKNIYR